MTTTAAFTYSPLPLPPSANPAYFHDLGRTVEGFDPETVSEEQMDEIIDMLYRVSAVNVDYSLISITNRVS